ncbi:MAG: glycoside hydrolase family 31 protein [Anaerolineae bacterium]
MLNVPEQFRLEFHPEAAHKAVVCLGSARFTVLTDRLIRLEYDPSGVFEDRASQTFWYREQPVPAFTAHADGSSLDIETEYLHLHYDAAGDRGFMPTNLSIRLKETGIVWHPGDIDPQNLRGTTRTLDVVNGFAPLSSGLISRAGWSLFDDSSSLVFNDECWLEPRPNPEIDWYFFGYGHDYAACLQDYCRVSGRAPMIPRWMLGNWWSRFWEYTQDELIQLVHDFQTHEIPLSVCIIDMDWHITKTGNRSTGWTGYTWNRSLFPDPQGVIAFLHANGLRTALNLHPAEGIHPHEESYPEMARRLGIDPASGEPVAFDIANPAFAGAYFEVLHHPYEAMGVDFWWLDWQQGLSCQMPGLDPLWLINHLHYYDLGRDGTRRPFIFSRWGDKGHQRYPIGFSGDSYATWDSLRFQPYMTATASNIAYGWWSHDIGGHISGLGDSELFARWVQFGVFSPIMRLHTTKGEYYDRRPWMFGDDGVERVLRDAMQLRHALIPYLYTMAWRAHEESLPLMLPMYYQYPESEAAYHCPHQYMFGTELIAAPFVEPADADTGLSRQVVWLPEGDWYHFFTGEHFAGDSWHAIYGRLNDIPLFARAGAIIPMGRTVGWGGIDNPTDLVIHCFAGADNAFTLYEDDGETGGYLAGRACRTHMALRWDGDRLTFTMDAPTGDLDLIPAARTIQLHVHGVKDATALVTIDGSAVAAASSYDPDTETLVIGDIRITSASRLEAMVAGEGETLVARRPRERETLLRLLKAFRLHAGVRNRIVEESAAILDDPDAIAPYLLPMSESQKRALMETLYQAGVHHVGNTHDPDLLVLWNNREDERITYRYGDIYLHFGFVRAAHHDNGVVPRFAAFAPVMQTWSDGALNEHVHTTQWQVQVDYHNLATSVESRREQTP